MWHSQDRQQNRRSSGKSATNKDMSRAGSVMLGARIVVEQSSLLNETHLLTPKSFREQSFRMESRKYFWDLFGVAKRQGLGTAGVE